MTKDRDNKKSFWEKLFGVIEEDDSSSVYQEDHSDDDGDLTSILEGSSKKIVPVFEGQEESPVDSGAIGDDEAEEKNEASESPRKEEILEEQSVSSEVREVEETLESIAPPPPSKIKVSYEASPDSYFFIHEGSTLKSLHDFEHCLGTMTESQFQHHVNSGKNDFASWVESAFGEKDLADSLNEAKEREVMHSVIKSFLDLK